jgi:hypothetical protein
MKIKIEHKDLCNFLFRMKLEQAYGYIVETADPPQHGSADA